jgi:hypothetical protein
MKPKDRILDWLQNEIESDSIKGWKYHKVETRTFWISIVKDDRPNRYSYEYGYVGKKGMWKGLTYKPNICKTELLGYMGRFSDDFTFDTNDSPIIFCQ